MVVQRDMVKCISNLEYMGIGRGALKDTDNLISPPEILN